MLTNKSKSEFYANSLLDSLVRHKNSYKFLSQLSGALPETLSLSLPWCEVFLTSPLPALRYHTATLLGIAARSSRDTTLADSWADRILTLLNDKVCLRFLQRSADLSLPYKLTKVLLTCMVIVKISYFSKSQSGTFEKHDGGILAAGFLAPCTSHDLTAKLLSKIILFFNSEHLPGKF